jgi:hypothetical protein
MESFDRLLQRLAFDERHGIERSVLILAQAVDWDDPRVLQPGGDDGLAEEPPPRRLVELVGTDLLERHPPIELFLMGGEDFSQTTVSMVALGPVDRQGAQEIGHPTARRRTVGNAVLRRGEESRGLDVEDRLQAPHGIDAALQLGGQLGTVGTQPLGGDLLSLTADLVPALEELLQAILGRLIRHRR